MKKIKIILIAFAVTFMLAGCSLTNSNSSSSTSTTDTANYAIEVTDTVELANVVKSKGLIFFYISDGNLGKACLEQVSALANEYKIKVYVLNVNNAEYAKNTTDANMQTVYTKLGEDAKFLSDGVTLVTPSLYEFKNGAVNNKVYGVAIDKFDSNNITADNLNTIKESYRPLFESQK